MCDNLGVEVESQRRKLKAKSWACTGEIPVQLEGSGQQRVVTMIDLNTVPLWLAGIDERKVAEHIRPKLVRYQKECARALADHFFGRRPPDDADPILTMIESARVNRLKQIDLEKRVQTAEVAALTAGNMAGQAMREARAANRTLDNQFGWYSVLAYCNRTGRSCSVAECSRHGKELTARLRGRGEEPQQVSDPRFGRVNLYPESLLAEHFGDTLA